MVHMYVYKVSYSYKLLLTSYNYLKFFHKVLPEAIRYNY